MRQREQLIGRFLSQVLFDLKVMSPSGPEGWPMNVRRSISPKSMVSEALSIVISRVVQIRVTDRDPTSIRRSLRDRR